MGAGISRVGRRSAFPRDSRFTTLRRAGLNAERFGLVLGQYLGLGAHAMHVIARPFVVDFAGAHLDEPPDYPPEVLAD